MTLAIPTIHMNGTAKENLIITRAEAMAAGLTRYFTGKPCPSGHIAERKVASYGCVPCSDIITARCYRQNLDHHRMVGAKRAVGYKARRATLDAQKDPARKASSHARWRQNNPGHMKAYMSAWFTRNPGRRAALNAAHRAAKIRACPSWADRETLLAIYAKCPSDLTVDHIVPLRGKTVCGLHVPWNLQYMTQSENLAKGNRLLAISEGGHRNV